MVSSDGVSCVLVLLGEWREKALVYLSSTKSLFSTLVPLLLSRGCVVLYTAECANRLPLTCTVHVHVHVHACLFIPLHVCT